MPTLSKAEPDMGKMVIFTAPSGAGKTTVVRYLLNKFNDTLAFSVSATTRPPRAQEVNGRDYYFITDEEFRRRIAAGEFVEWEEVYPGRFYGTLRSEVERLWLQDKIILFDIDVKGAQSLKQAFPRQSLAVFVKPPSAEALFERLRRRSTESEESLLQRIGRASEELTYENKFDTILVNDKLEDTLKSAEDIVLQFINS